MFGVGNYPPEYNAKVHGPYNPGTFYGKPDPLAEAKVGEFTQWLARRNYHPAAMARACGRGYHSWAQKWMLVKKPTMAPFFQIALGISVLYYVQLYGFLKYHRNVKYHW